MPHLLRLFLAAVALTAIAALTSIGLYAVAVGGVTFGSASARAANGVAPVLVTIQALPVTPTVVPVATSTPMPASLIPGLAQAGPSLVPPATAPAPLDTRPATLQPAPSPIGSPFALAAASPTPPAQAVAQTGLSAPPVDGARQAIHDGLTLDLVGVERNWQATGADGSPLRTRDGYELLAVLVRLVNGAGETRYAADTDFALVADDGSRFAARQTAPVRGPQLLTLPVPANDTVRGWLTFEAPIGSAPKRLQWSPTRPDRARAEATYLVPLP